MTGAYKTNSDGEFILYTTDEAAIVGHSFYGVVDALREAREEVARLEREHTRLHAQVVAAVGVGGAVALSPDVSVVVEPGQPGRRTVDRVVAALYREELVGLKLGRVVTEYRPPTVAEVNAARALVIAAGVNLAALIPDVPAGSPRVTVVDKRVTS
jgi:hypothetical protein